MSAFKYDGKDLEAMSFAVNYHRAILKEFASFIGKQVGEIGAGKGSFSKLLLTKPIDSLVAVEPDRNMYELLRSGTAHDPRVVTRNSFFGDVSSEYPEHFDTLLYVNVFEHIEDDVAELTSVYAALKLGGHLCVFVPALPWLYSAHDASIGHYRRYSKKELIERLEKAGFEIVKARYFDILGIIPWFFIVKLFKKSPGGGSVSLYDNLIVPLSQMMESMIPPPIGKNLVIVGRKNQVAGPESALNTKVR